MPLVPLISYYHGLRMWVEPWKFLYRFTIDDTYVSSTFCGHLNSIERVAVLSKQVFRCGIALVTYQLWPPLKNVVMVFCLCSDTYRWTLEKYEWLWEVFIGNGVILPNSKAGNCGASWGDDYVTRQIKRKAIFPCGIWTLWFVNNEWFALRRLITK